MSKIVIGIWLLIISVFLLTPKIASAAATCSIESGTITKGKLYSVTGSGLAKNKDYYIYFGTRAVLLVNKKTDDQGNLNAHLNAVAGSDWFQPGTYPTEIRANNFEKCDLGTITLQNPTNTQGYKLDAAKTSCLSCTIGSEAACTFSDLASCQQYIKITTPTSKGNFVYGCTEQQIRDKQCTGASGVPCPNGQPGINTALGCLNPEPAALVQQILRFSMGIGGGIAFLLMIFGAFQMITSAGSAEALKAGQERFYSAIIGLLFLIFSVILLKIIGVDILGFGTYFGLP